MKIIDIKGIDKQKVTDFFTSHWGSPQMVVSSGIYHCDELDGYAVTDEKSKIIGLITFIEDGSECEIISLDSRIENNGIGSSLIQTVEEYCKTRQINRIKLVTTNDNLHALSFYQKRGYELEALFPKAVEKARKLKSTIPLKADNGIPIRDELQLVKRLCDYSFNNCVS
ncbi:GNAT family N-acetyltransferase [Bacillus suaedaesalsae]|uniref:GNAT family N-acetyltransferase n=1 Tax=Bacillus suaedaesalsae TaxID=2810349 RepID=A0ABS2DG47_9BACI|nr:GNAT family N-acetyltransferase [Bacillus suaedaesalsae]MBM6617440.1 GNAT family N-acetyltransferase [Bacillus suaedaesalsae]